MGKNSLLILICLCVFLLPVRGESEIPLRVKSEDELIFEELEAAEASNSRENDAATVLTQWNVPYSYSVVKPANQTAAEFYFTFEADESLFGLEIVLESDAELSLFINHETNEVDLKAGTERESGKKIIRLSRFYTPRLADGIYYGVVVYESALREEQTISFTLTLCPQDLPVTETVGVNHPVQWQSGGAQQPSMAYYALDLPASSRVLRADVFRSDTDVDLYLFAGKPDYRLDRAVCKSETYAGCETILLTEETSPRMNPGEKYFLLIYDRHPAPSIGTVEFVLSDGIEPPLAARRAMTIPFPDEDPKKNAVNATIEILCEQSTGTGFIISPKGYILTALHVLRRADGTLSKTIIGSVNTDVRKPAAERFRLKLIDSDASKDIALLKIDSMLFGAYPSEMSSLPSFSLSNRARIDIGDALMTLGYPRSGGSASKNSVKMARGILSGYEMRSGTAFLISDIKADSGNSGGPVFDSLFRIAGISQSLLQSDYSYLLCIYPIDALPSSWLEMIRDDR